MTLKSRWAVAMAAQAFELLRGGSEVTLQQRMHLMDELHRILLDGLDDYLEMSKQEAREKERQRLAEEWVQQNADIEQGKAPAAKFEVVLFDCQTSSVKDRVFNAIADTPGAEKEKDLVFLLERQPAVVWSGESREDAERLKRGIEQAGGKALIR
jgi:hypothetical protein